MFKKEVTQKELRAYKAGKPVRAAVAQEAANRKMNSSGNKAAAAIRRNIKKNVNGR